MHLKNLLKLVKKRRRSRRKKRKQHLSQLVKEQVKLNSQLTSLLNVLKNLISLKNLTNHNSSRRDHRRRQKVRNLNNKIKLLTLFCHRSIKSKINQQNYQNQLLITKYCRKKIKQRKAMPYNKRNKDQLTSMPRQLQSINH